MSEPTLSIASPAPRLEELEIRTIPDKYYGTALNVKIEEKRAVPEATAVVPAKHSGAFPAIIVGIIFLVGVGGGFAYFNRALLFPAPQTPVTPTPEPVKPVSPPIPTAPTTVVATSTNPQTVIVSWVDTSESESGFRVERRDNQDTFRPLTSLPPNSTSFLDTSVQPKTAYAYRVRAINSTGESDPSPEAAASTADLPPPPPEAPKLPPAGLDSDSDGLSDVEETLFGTDRRNPDTDTDGFLDGNEVFHLYNPNGRAPARLSDLGLIKSSQGTIGWVMDIPTSWTVTPNTADGSKTTIDSKHGETFVITVEENSEKKPVVDWYLDKHPGVTTSQVLQYRSKGGYTGMIGADLLTTYIPWGDKIFVFTYDLDGQTFINFRTTYSMMLNSLMLSGLPQVSLPVVGAPLPFEPSATSSGTIAQPIPVETPTSSDATQSSTSSLP